MYCIKMSIKTPLLLCIIFSINYTNYAQKLVNSIDDLPKLVDSIYAKKFLNKPVGYLLSEVYYNFNVIITSIASPGSYRFIIGDDEKDPQIYIEVDPNYFDSKGRLNGQKYLKHPKFKTILNEFQAQVLKEDALVRCIHVSISSKNFDKYYGYCGLF